MKPSRKPWHYDAIKGRPIWSKNMGREAGQLRQIDKDCGKGAAR